MLFSGLCSPKLAWALEYIRARQGQHPCTTPHQEWLGGRLWATTSTDQGMCSLHGLQKVGNDTAPLLVLSACKVVLGTTVPWSVGSWLQDAQAIREQWNYIGWFLNCMVKDVEPDKAIVLMLLYHMWLTWNDAWNGKPIEDPKRVIDRVWILLDEWLRLHDDTRRRRFFFFASDPEEGRVKANADGATGKSENSGGGAVIIRDHYSEFLAGAWHFLLCFGVLKLVELLACRHAAQLAMEVGVQKLPSEMAYQGAIKAFSGTNPDRPMHGPLIEGIKAIPGNFDQHRIKRVRRSANKAAHFAQKKGSS